MSTTTDCWSARSRSYIGVTAHWIDAESMCHVSAALACRRLTGSHTYDVLAGAIDAIHGDYSLRQKVCRTTTDSGSNFVKTFSVFATRECDEAAENDDDSERRKATSRTLMSVESLTPVMTVITSLRATSPVTVTLCS